MATIPLLPQLTKKYGQTNREPGWRHVNFGALREIADLLKIEEASRAIETYNSIPDIWAQVLQFETALLDQAEPNERARNMWRALIALWALRSALRMPVGFHVLKLEPSAALPFLSAAARLKPISTRAGEKEWTEVGIVSYAGVPIGIANPATLLAPSAGAFEKLERYVPQWFGNGSLLDVTKVLLGRNRDLVCASLRHVERELGQKRLAHRAAEADTRTSRFIDLIHAFQTDLARVGASAERATAVAMPLGLSSGPLTGALNQKFETLDGEAQPGFYLKAREELSSLGIRGLLVADRSIASTLGVSAESIEFWNDFSLARVTDDKAIYEEVKREAADKGYLLVRPEELFSKVLCRIQERQMTAHRSTCSEYALPVEPLVLGFLSPQKLVQSIEITPISETDRQVSLEMSLTSTADDGVIEHKVFHRFDREVWEEAPSPCGIWPDFKLPGWNTYFLLSRNRRGETICPEHAFVLSDAASRIAEAQDLGEKVGKLAKIRSLLRDNCARRIIDPSPVKPTETAPVHWLHGLPNVPEAIICDADAQHRSADQRRDNPAKPKMEYAGLLIVPTKSLSPSYEGITFRDISPIVDERPWVVGIDFGTSNTSVYMRSPGRGANKLTLSRRIVSPFTSEPGTAQDVYISHGVLGIDTTAVFQTILQCRPTRRELPAGDREAWGGADIQAPVWSKRVMFNSKLTVNIRDFNDRNSEKVFGREMKWGFGIPGQAANLLGERVGGYLRQVILQSLAECASQGVPPQQVELRFSYPEAFGHFTRGTFERLCDSALRSPTDGLTAKNIKVDTRTLDRGIFDRSSESRCAALYFAIKHEAYLGETLIVLDVGGGTTDVVIIRGHKVLFRCSLRLAGQDVFIAPLQKAKLIENYLDNTNTPDVVFVREQYASIDDDVSKRDAIEMIVNSCDFSDNAADARGMLKIASSNSEDAKWLNGITTLAFGGLIYYVGQALRQSLGEAALNAFGSDERIHICFAGRGSRMFRDFVPPRTRTAAIDLFREASGLPHAIIDDFIFSTDPKEEVAYGLVVGDEDQLKIDWQNDNVILPPFGEDVCDKSGKSMLDAKCSYRDFGTQATWKLSSTMPRFNEFLKCFENHTGVSIKIDPSVISKIRSDANEALAREVRTVTGELARLAELKNGDQTYNGKTEAERKIDATLRSRQPPFIILLRETIRSFVSEGPHSCKAKIDVGA